MRVRKSKGGIIFSLKKEEERRRRRRAGTNFVVSFIAVLRDDVRFRVIYVFFAFVVRCIP